MVIKVKYLIPIFSNIKSPFYINDYIISNISSKDSTVIVIWGNHIPETNTVNIIEPYDVKSEYKKLHNIFRQQLPLPLGSLI